MRERQIKHFRLLRELGHGAAGEVFLATSLKATDSFRPGQPLAIKIYKPEILQQPNQLKRIEQEFKIGSTLSHPNLVRIFEYNPPEGTTPPFLVMEYVDGLTLDSWLQMYHPTSRRVSLRIVSQLVDALRLLHENNIIHRDIKPTNIMISSSFEAKLMDFGVAWAEKDTPVTPITPAGKMLGTLRNIAPECLEGAPATNRSDLYSFGTVLHALLYGKEIFSEEEDKNRLLSLILKGPPEFDPSPQGRDEVSEAIFEIMRSLLKRQPEDRLGDITQVQGKLDSLERGNAFGGVEPLHGYIATALTGLDVEVKEAVSFVSSRIAEVAKEYELYVYQPRKASDPLLHPDLSSTAVYLLDRERVLKADVLFVLANRPSFGVGQEVEIAASVGKPMILIVREGTAISRMLTGTFANLIGDQIMYQTPEDLGERLKKLLTLHLDSVRTAKTFRDKPISRKIGARVMSLRVKSGYNEEELAESTGVNIELIKALESQRYEGVSVEVLLRIADVFGITLDDLTGPREVIASPQLVTDPNLTRLEKVSIEMEWSLKDYIHLREEYAHQFAASGDVGALMTEQWIKRKNALDEWKAKAITHTEKQKNQLGFFSDDKE